MRVDTIGKIVESQRDKPITGEEKISGVFGKVTDEKQISFNGNHHIPRRFAL